MELLFIILFAYLKNIKKDKLRKAVDLAAEKAKTSMPNCVYLTGALVCCWQFWFDFEQSRHFLAFSCWRHLIWYNPVFLAFQYHYRSVHGHVMLTCFSTPVVLVYWLTM